MKYLLNINRTDNCWNQFGIECAVWNVFMFFYFLSLFLMQPTTENIWTKKLATRKKNGPTKYPRENILDPRNTHDKNIWTHEIPMRKIFEPTKYPSEKNWDPRNTQEKKFQAYELPARNTFGP